MACTHGGNPCLEPMPDRVVCRTRRFAYAMELAKEAGLISAGDSLILAHGNPDGTQSLSDFQMALAA